MATTDKGEFMRWLDGELERDPHFKKRVEEILNEIRIEQDLIALRERRKLSQVQVARMLGVTQPAIAKIESGRYKNLQIKTLARLAAALGARIRIEVTAAEPPRRQRARRSA